MEPILKQVIDDIGGPGQVPGVMDSDRLSEARIGTALKQLAGLRDGQLDVVAFGSLARREMTPESDFDYLVLVRTVPESSETVRAALDAALELSRRFAVEEGKDPDQLRPGASGLFGRAVGAFDLIETIGLQDDTNHSMTRRMLLLEESVSLMDPSLHRSVIGATVQRYLGVIDTETLTKPPRFLINDVVRYWRTITVDYQAKASGGADNKSVLRYLKLVISRKILFAGTVMALLRCGMGQVPVTVEGIADELGKRPLARLVGGYGTAPQPVQQAMQDVVRVADRFLSSTGSLGWREDIKGLQWSKRTSSQVFTKAKEDASRLQEALKTIFFEWSDLAELSRDYLVF